MQGRSRRNRKVSTQQTEICIPGLLFTSSVSWGKRLQISPLSALPWNGNESAPWVIHQWDKASDSLFWFFFGALAPRASNNNPFPQRRNCVKREVTVQGGRPQDGNRHKDLLLSPSPQCPLTSALCRGPIPLLLDVFILGDYLFISLQTGLQQKIGFIAHVLLELPFIRVGMRLQRERWKEVKVAATCVWYGERFRVYIWGQHVSLTFCSQQLES